MGSVCPVIAGYKFGMWAVVGPEVSVKRSGRKRVFCNVLCECGKSGTVLTNALRSGRSTGCGCTRKEKFHARKHGKYKTAIYRVWLQMRDRCRNPNNKKFQDYGGRGVQVCDEWNSFEAFSEWALSHGWKKGLQIDRQNNDGNYEPGNCRFVTAKVNSNNSRRVHLVKAFGETKTISGWSEDSRCVVCYPTLVGRINRGISPELAITAEWGKQ